MAVGDVGLSSIELPVTLTHIPTARLSRVLPWAPTKVVLSTLYLTPFTTTVGDADPGANPRTGPTPVPLTPPVVPGVSPQEASSRSGRSERIPQNVLRCTAIFMVLPPGWIASSLAAISFSPLSGHPAISIQRGRNGDAPRRARPDA